MTNSDMSARIDSILDKLQSGEKYMLQVTIGEAAELARGRHDFQPAGQLLLAYALAESVACSEDLDSTTAEARHKKIQSVIDGELYFLRPICKGASKNTRFIAAHMIVLGTITADYDIRGLPLGGYYAGFHESFERYNDLTAKVAALEAVRSEGSIPMSSLGDLERRQNALESELTRTIESTFSPHWEASLRDNGAGTILNWGIVDLCRDRAMLKKPVPTNDYTRPSGNSKMTE